MKIIILLFVLAFCSSVFSQSNNNVEKEKYKKKYEQIDTTIYFDKYLEISNYIFGGIHTIGITVKKELQGKKVSFYLDSLKHFYRNGQLKRIQVSDSLGTPILIREYNKNNELIQEMNFNYTESIPFLLSPNPIYTLKCYMKKYKNGILIREGLYVNKKKEGLHITYDKNGNIKSKMIFKNNKVIEK